MRTLLLMTLVGLGACSSTTELSVGDVSAELVSCNGQSAPDTMALYLDLSLRNEGDDALEVTRVTLSTRDSDVVVSGSQTATPPITIAPSASADLACKDGFTVTGFPGEGVETAIQVRIDYRVGQDEGTLVVPATMRASIAWDNCDTFLGDAVMCHAQ